MQLLVSHPTQSAPPEVLREDQDRRDLERMRQSIRGEGRSGDGAHGAGAVGGGDAVPKKTKVIKTGEKVIKIVRWVENPQNGNYIVIT